MEGRTKVLLVACASWVLCACIAVFAPPIRAELEHAGVGATDRRDVCMGCHVAEKAALAGTPAGEAPLVADWMIEDRRECLGCHDLRGHRR